jgi:hypothetical protein
MAYGLQRRRRQACGPSVGRIVIIMSIEPTRIGPLA